MRRFQITNENNVTIDLNGATGIYLVNPSGLGVSLNDFAINVNNGFFQLGRNPAIPEQSIPCDIVFRNGYRNYGDFINFLLGAESLTLSYIPESKRYVRQVRLISIGKTELQAGMLSCPVTFGCLTPWYSLENIDITMRPSGGSPMTYPFTYSDDLVYGSGGNYEATVIASGHIEPAFALSYDGEIDNPVISVIGSDSGRLYGECRVIGSLASLDYSSEYADPHLLDGAVDAIQMVSPASDPFLRIPFGEPCKIRLTASSTLDIVGSVRIFSYWRSV